MPELLQWLGGKALRIGVSRHAVSLVRTSRWGGQRAEAVAEQAFSTEDATPHHDHQAIAIALGELLAGRDVAGWPVSFVLADELVRMWQVAPPANAARQADLEAAAALRFFSLYGEAASGWQLAGDWDTQAPFFVAAMPRPLLAVLQQAASEHGMPVVEIQPHFVTAWNRWRRAVKPGAWFGQVHDGLLMLGVTVGTRLQSVRALPMPPASASTSTSALAWLAQAVRREALLAGVEPPALLQLCGAVPPVLAKPATDGGLSIAMLGAALPGESSPVMQLARGGWAA